MLENSYKKLYTAWSETLMHCIAPGQGVVFAQHAVTCTTISTKDHAQVGTRTKPPARSSPAPRSTPLTTARWEPKRSWCSETALQRWERSRNAARRRVGEHSHNRGGRMTAPPVVPGLLSIHMHTRFGRCSARADCGPEKAHSIPGIIALLQEAALTAPAGVPIRGYGDRAPQPDRRASPAQGRARSGRRSARSTS